MTTETASRSQPQRSRPPRLDLEKVRGHSKQPSLALSALSLSLLFKLLICLLFLLLLLLLLLLSFVVVVVCVAVYALLFVCC